MCLATAARGVSICHRVPERPVCSELPCPLMGKVHVSTTHFSGRLPKLLKMISQLKGMGNITRVSIMVQKHDNFKNITFFSLDIYLGQRRDDEEEKVGQNRGR